MAVPSFLVSLGPYVPQVLAPLLTAQPFPQQAHRRACPLQYGRSVLPVCSGRGTAEGVHTRLRHRTKQLTELGNTVSLLAGQGQAQSPETIHRTGRSNPECESSLSPLFISRSSVLEGNERCQTAFRTKQGPAENCPSSLAPSHRPVCVAWV